MFIPVELEIILSFIAAFLVVFSSIPTLVTVANVKKLYDEPGKRKAHKLSVPTLGGVAIFVAVLLPIGIFTSFSQYLEFQYIFIASIILFFVGIKDDVLVTAPLKKLAGQIVSVLIIIVLGDFKFTSLHGFLGIYELNYFVSLVLTLFVFIVIINGVNLIDGIDGLASGVGILASTVFGTWFFLNAEYAYSIISFSLVGALLAFFYFNVFGTKNKIFMGDTGSLILGLFMAILSVKFNEMNINESGKYFIHAAPTVSFGILIVPLFDTLRVFVIRTLKGHSPFKADRNHVHHKLLSMGFSHIKATSFIILSNILIIIIVFTLNAWGIIDLMLLVLIVAIIISVLPEIMYFIKEKRSQLG
jgi:UDP-N-acetylmuramyl pentapeptide phosphotransferase/UDP-N-acetylglucosamine-1-phosphate transferase